MAGGPLDNARLPHSLLDGALDSGLMDVMASLLAGLLIDPAMLGRKNVLAGRVGESPAKGVLGTDLYGTEIGLALRPRARIDRSAAPIRRGKALACRLRAEWLAAYPESAPPLGWALS